MSTVHARSKAARGTKRTCPACEVRFYDLGRDPIVCPMCGAVYAPPPAPAPHAAAAPFGNKTGWHRQPIERLQPAAPAADAMSGDRFTAGPAGEDIADGAAVDADEVGEDSVVLDEQDDTDVADLVERDDADENEPR